MTWTYSNPSASDKDAVRFNIGDVSSTDQQLSDEEILYVLSGQPSVTLAAIACCSHLISHYARLVSQSVGAVSVQYNQRMQNYEQVLSRLRRRLAPAPYIGGISSGDKEGNQEDDDWVQPVFSRGMNTRSGG